MNKEILALIPIWGLAMLIVLSIAFVAFHRLSGWKSYVVPGVCTGILLGPCIFEVPFGATPLFMPSGIVWPMIAFSVIFEGDSLESVPYGVLLYPPIMVVLCILGFYVGTKFKKKPTNAVT